jgi:putative SOS response-associated peptidase YedK
MCTNYEPPDKRRFEAFAEFPTPNFDYPGETYKDYPAPIWRHVEGENRTDRATFAMVPRKHIPAGVKLFDTMNAKTETLAERRSFSGAWKRLQLCLIPCAWFFEPNYESGKAVRWRIGLATGEPFALAGLWREWKEDDGSAAYSFTMLTVNADDHVLLRRFHAPGKEKRGIVIVPREGYDDWLGCRSTDEARSFFSLYPADLMRAEAAPPPPRKAAART